MAVTMTVSQALTAVLLRATGKVSTLGVTDTKGVKILAFLNYFQNVWALSTNVDWNSLKTTFTLGTVSNTDTFDLDSDIGRLSQQEGDYVRITTTTQEFTYTIVPLEKLYKGAKLNHWDNGKCSVVGQSLIFAHKFVSTDPQFGGSIVVPGFSIPDPLVNANDEIAVDDPNWLVAISAAEYDRTDITRVQYYPGLKDEADELMYTMKRHNDSQQEMVYQDGWNPMPNSGGAFD